MRFFEFIQTESKNKKNPFYMRFIADRIEEKFLMNITVPRILMISMPPRSLKTTISTKYFIVWILEYFQRKKIGLYSYSRNITNLHIKLLPTILNNKIKNLNKFTSAKIDTVIIDDYNKNIDLAKFDLDNTFYDFQKICRSLTSSNSFILIISSRYAKNDLIGRILYETLIGGLPFLIDYVNIPALALQFDPLHRIFGSSFWPEKYPENKLLEIKNNIDEKWWKTTYQGTPE